VAGAIIDLGSGDDTLTAVGSTLGIFEATILAGRRNDTLDLQSGSGMVDGGSGYDEPLLADAIGAFTITEIASGVNISDGGVTDLNVTGVERFIFDGVAFDFADLVA